LGPRKIGKSLNLIWEKENLNFLKKKKIPKNPQKKNPPFPKKKNFPGAFNFPKP